MKKTFGEKFKAWRNAKGVSSVKIERATGISASNLISIEKGRRPASDTVLMKLASMPELGIDYETLKGWQLESKYGENPLISPSITLPPPVILPPPVSLPPPVVLPLPVTPHPSVALQGSNLQYVGPITNARRLPIKGVVSAGGMTLVEESELGYVEWYNPTDDSPEIFALKVVGDSMWPPVPDGAILTVKPCKRFQNKCWYVVQTEDGEATFKIVEANGDDLILVPLNPSYAPIKVKGSKVQCMWEVLRYEVSKK